MGAKALEPDFDYRLVHTQMEGMRLCWCKDTSLDTWPSRTHKEDWTSMYLKRLERFEISSGEN